MTGQEAPVGIVGGGLAGLTCAYFLTSTGVPCTVFEANSRIGGRLDTIVHEGRRLDLGAKAFPKKSPAFSDLIRRLGLADRVRSPKSSDRVALHTADGSIVCTAKEIASDEKLSSREKASAGLYFIHHARRTRIPDAGPRADPLHNQTWADDIREQCGDNVLERLFRPLALAISFAPPEEISALAGRLTIQALLSPLGRLDGGFASLLAALVDGIGPTGRIQTSTKVVGLSPCRDGFNLALRQDKTRRSVFVGRLVLALPLPQAARLLPAAGPEDRIPVLPYRRVVQLIVHGRLRSQFAGNYINLLVSNSFPLGVLTVRLEDDLFSVTRPGETLWEEIPDALFESGARIVPVDEDWQGPLNLIPIQGPGVDMPGPTAELPNLFFCGDFHYMRGIESAVLTGREAAQHVVQSLDESRTTA